MAATPMARSYSRMPGDADHVAKCVGHGRPVPGRLGDLAGLPHPGLLQLGGREGLVRGAVLAVVMPVGGPVAARGGLGQDD